MAIDLKGAGSLPLDPNHKPIQVTYNHTQQDASSTPKVSPLTVSTVVLELVPPGDAIQLIIRATVADIRHGDNNTLDGTAADGYTVIPAGTAKEIDCADGASIFVLRDAGTDATANFEFKRLRKL